MKFLLKKVTAAILSALGIAALAGGAAGCAKKSAQIVEPDNIEITKLAPPDDGSLPTAHSCAENLAYVNYVFDRQEQYHSYSYGVTSASIATQTTRTFRDFKNGVLVTTDLTYSSMIKNSTQTCTVLGDEEKGSEVYFRPGDAPKSNEVVPTDIGWNESAPTYFSERSYHYVYGLLPTELFNYIINDDTLISSEEVVKNPDGTYTQSFSLDPVASTYFYQFGMKTRGGLSSYPEFNSISFSVAFDSGWRILSSTMHEVAKVNKGVVVDSISDFTCDYWYGEDHFDNAHYAYYENYYKQYVGDETLTSGGSSQESAPLDVTSALSNGFAQIMNGGQQFELSAKLGNNTYSGYVWLSLDLADIAGSLAIKASLGRNLHTQNFYAEYGAGELSVYYGGDFGIYANLAEVKLEAQQFEKLINDIVEAITGKNPADKQPLSEEVEDEESPDALAALLNDMKLEVNENSANLSLVTNDLLGLGIGINAQLEFGLSGNNVIFRSATVGGLSIGGNPVDIELVLRTTAAPLISRETTETEANIADYVADVYSLLSSDLLKISVGLDGNSDKVNISALKGISVDVTALVDLTGVTVGAEAAVAYTANGANISAKLEVIYDYVAGTYGKAWLYLKELNGSPVSLKVNCDIKELADAISGMLMTEGAGLSLDTFTLSGILDSALSADFSNLISNMYADKAQIKIGVNVDTLLNMLGVHTGIEFGSCSLVYKKGEGLFAALSAIGFTLGVEGQSGEIARFDTSDSLDISYVLDDVLAVMNGDLYKVDLSIDGSQEGVTLSALKGLTADVSAYVGIKPAITAAVEACVSYTYENCPISATLAAWYDGGANKVILSLTELMGMPVSVKLTCNIDEIVEGIGKILAFAGKSADISLGDGLSVDLSGVLANVLTADFAALLPEAATTSSGLKLAVNVDEVLSLFNLDLGISFGNVTLMYNHSNAPLLEADVAALGLGVSFAVADGAVEIPAADNCLDLCYVIDDVLTLAENGLFKVELKLGEEREEGEELAIPQLEGITADVVAYLDINGLTASLTADISYKLDEDNTVSATLSVWYEYIEGGYGKVYLSLGRINGVATSINVCCDIKDTVESVKAILKRASVETGDVGGTLTVDTANILGNVLASLADGGISKLITKLETGADNIKLGVNVDEVLSVFGVDIGIKFGSVGLTYVHGQDDILTAEVASLGASLTIGGANDAVKVPSYSWLDAADVISTANSVWDQIDGIIENCRVNFAIDKTKTFLALDGIVIGFGGSGEVCWKEGEEIVALDLAMSITQIDGEVTYPSDTASVKVLYNKNADENTPLVRLSINEVGLDIYKDDIDGVVEGFKDIYNKVKGLLGSGAEGSEGKKSDGSNETTKEESGIEVYADTEGATAEDTLIGTLFGILASDGWVKFLNDFTLTSNGKSVALSYLADNAANVRVGADGNLRLTYDGSFGKYDDRMSELLGGRRFALGGDIIVTSDAGSTAENINAAFDIINRSSKKTSNATFIRLAYDFLFEGISCFDVTNILGSDTYSVQFELNGKNCNIDALKDVYIKANIYVTGAEGEQSKLAEGELDLNVKGVAIKLNVITERVNGNTRFYINLSQVMDILLPDLKFVATQSSLYDTIDVLVTAVNDTDIVDFIGKLMSQFSTEGEPDGKKEAKNKAKSETRVTKEQAASIATIVEGLANFNLNEAFVATSSSGNLEENGVLDAYLDLDNILAQLGIKGEGFGKLGKMRVKINHNDHSMTTYGQTDVVNADGVEERVEWISLSSALVSRKDYSKLDKDEYINVEFLPDLLSDAVKFATDDEGNVYDTFTLSGTIGASLIGFIDINIDISTLTLSLAEDDLSFSGVLHINTAKALGITVIPECTVGVTYQKGYITLVKNLKSTPEFKVMTLPYFIDHMLIKNNSVLEWWLNISAWDFVMNFVQGKVSLDSGLSNPEQIYLYNKVTETAQTEISMYSYVECLKVAIDGLVTAHFGDGKIAAFESSIADTAKSLGRTFDKNNYYGFSLNGDAVTGGILKTLYAAITRNSNGISGILANGNVKDLVKFSVALDYKEGLTKDYEIGNSVTADVRAPSFYNKAVTLAGDEEKFDFEHNVQKASAGYDEIFGCATVSGSDGSISIDYSKELYKHNVTLPGEKKAREIRHGSTIYLYDNESPIFTDETKAYRTIYSADPNKPSGTTFTVNEDSVIYALAIPSASVIIHSGAESYTLSTFVGDLVPTAIRGLENIGGLYYDEAKTQPVGANDKITGAQTLHLYGVFVQSTVTINKVIYKFTYAPEREEGGYYTVVGRAAGFNSIYCKDDAPVLVLESSIGGYPVIAIEAEALANNDGGSIRAVVVPASIVTVGELAFKNNYGMQFCVFLADEVTLHGSSGDKESDNTTVFFGCGDEAGSKSTNLTIYYNVVRFENSTTNMYWTKFYSDTGTIRNRYYIGVDPNGTSLTGIGDYEHTGGGALFSAGKWQCVLADYSLDTSGVASTKLTEELLGEFFAGYYPVATTVQFVGGAKAAEIEQQLALYLSTFNVTNKGVTYKCGYTVSYETVGCTVIARFDISFTAAVTVTVVSNYDCVYEGASVTAGEAKDIIISADKLENLSTPTSAQYVLTDMTVTEDGEGRKIITLVWREKYTYTLTFTFKGGLSNTVTMEYDGSTTSQKTSGSVIKGYKTTFTLQVTEGQAVSVVGNGSTSMNINIDGQKVGEFTCKSYSFKSGYSYEKTVTANDSYQFEY